MPSEDVQETTATSATLLEQLAARDGRGIILLKGGDDGAMHPALRPRVLAHLERWFVVTEGEPHLPSFAEVVTRWGAGLRYQFRRMRANPRIPPAFVDAGEELLLTHDARGFDAWMEDAGRIASDDPGYLRQVFALEYLSREGMQVLLVTRAGIDRATILRDLGLEDADALLRAVGPTRAAIDWVDSGATSFQEFVKRIVIGETASYRAAPGTVRSIVAAALRSGVLRPAMERAKALAARQPAVWQSVPGDYCPPGTDEEEVIASFMNGSHTVDATLEELRFSSRRELAHFCRVLAGGLS